MPDPLDGPDAAPAASDAGAASDALASSSVLTSPDGAPTPVAPRRARPLPPRANRRTLKNTTHRWVRWLHVYTSMIAFLVVLFFGITGITLNHPTWTFGDKVDHREYSGTLPSGLSGESVDFLDIAEFVRTTYDVSEPVADHTLDQGQGTVSFRGPGYEADLFFTTDDGHYDLTIDQQGFVQVMNDLHKGRDTNSAWKWVIDLSGGFLVVVALTGLGIQLFLKKRRTRALLFAAGGLVVTVVFIVLTL